MKKTILCTTWLAIVMIAILPAKVFSQWNQAQWVVNKYEPYVYNFVFNGSNEALAYRLLRPINFDATKKYPVVITLHGASGFNKVNANDYNINNLRAVNGQFAIDSIRIAHPTYVICLQAIKFPDGSTDMWSRKHLAGAKQIIASLPNVDINRIYLMGQSAGGFGVNNFLNYDANYFAAAIACSAEGNKISVTNRDKLKYFNLWTLHGDNDNVIPYSGDVELFDYMKGINALMKFTTFIDRGHSTEELMVGNYSTTGKISISDTDPNTGIITSRIYDYTTQYAGTGSDPESNTLDWLFSKNKIFTEPIKAYRISTGINVDWATILEINCDRFELERSTNNNNADFKKIASIKGQINSNANRLYSIFDAQPNVGVNYYRIKQINLDGTFNYSKVLSANYEYFEIKIAPNPVSNLLTILTSLPIEKIEILNAVGQVVKNYLGYKLILDVQSLAKGSYYLKMYVKDQQVITKQFSKF